MKAKLTEMEFATSCQLERDECFPCPNAGSSPGTMLFGKRMMNSALIDGIGHEHMLVIMELCLFHHWLCS